MDDYMVVEAPTYSEYKNNARSISVQHSKII